MGIEQSTNRVDMKEHLHRLRNLKEASSEFEEAVDDIRCRLKLHSRCVRLRKGLQLAFREQEGMPQEVEDCLLELVDSSKKLEDLLDQLGDRPVLQHCDCDSLGMLRAAFASVSVKVAEAIEILSDDTKPERDKFHVTLVSVTECILRTAKTLGPLISVLGVATGNQYMTSVGLALHQLRRPKKHNPLHLQSAPDAPEDKSGAQELLDISDDDDDDEDNEKFRRCLLNRRGEDKLASMSV